MIGICWDLSSCFFLGIGEDVVTLPRLVDQSVSKVDWRETPTPASGTVDFFGGTERSSQTNRAERESQSENYAANKNHLRVNSYSSTVDRKG